MAKRVNKIIGKNTKIIRSKEGAIKLGPMKFEAFSEVGNFNSSELIQEVEKLNILITLKKTKKRCQLSLKKQQQQHIHNKKQALGPERVKEKIFETLKEQQLSIIWKLFPSIEIYGNLPHLLSETNIIPLSRT